MNPVRTAEGLTAGRGRLLTLVAEGKPIKAIAAARHTTPAAVADDVERLLLRLAEGVSSGADGALQRLRRLHEAIVEREEQGETLGRLLPGGVAEQAAAGGHGHRRDRAARGHRADVATSAATRRSPSTPTRPRWPPSSTPTGPR